jgi:hypothetical protein
LAEENARFSSSVSAANSIFKNDLINGNIANPSLPGIPQFSSSFQPEFAANTQFNPVGIANNSNAYLSSLPELSPTASMNMFGSSSHSQAQWLNNKYTEAAPFGAANLSMSSLPRGGLKEEEESEGNLYSNNQNIHQQGAAAHMSATALLQKAAQMGSTRSNPVFNGSSFRLMSSSNSTSRNHDEVQKFFRQQNQAENLNGLMSSNPSSFLANTKDLEHMLVLSANGKQDQAVISSGRLHASSNEVERSLTRDFLGVGEDASRPFLQQELAKFASMGAAMDLSQYGHHHK